MGLIGFSGVVLLLLYALAFPRGAEQLANQPYETLKGWIILGVFVFAGVSLTQVDIQGGGRR